MRRSTSRSLFDPRGAGQRAHQAPAVGPSDPPQHPQTVAGQWRSQINDAVSIWERPAEAEGRAVPGHWEGDLLLGRGLTQIATVVERSTRFTVLVQLDGWDMVTVAQRLSVKMAELPEQLRAHADLGPWDGAGRPQGLDRRDRAGRLLRRPAQLLAARHH
jgi:hypothetical protein